MIMIIITIMIISIIMFVTLFLVTIELRTPLRLDRGEEEALKQRETRHQTEQLRY